MLPKKINAATSSRFNDLFPELRLARAPLVLPPSGPPVMGINKKRCHKPDYADSECENDNERS